MSCGTNNSVEVEDVVAVVTLDVVKELDVVETVVIVVVVNVVKLQMSCPSTKLVLKLVRVSTVFWQTDSPPTKYKYLGNTKNNTPTSEIRTI